MIRDQHAHEVGRAGKLKGSNVALHVSEDGLISISAQLLEITGGDRVSGLSASIGGSFTPGRDLITRSACIYTLHCFFITKCN